MNTTYILHGGETSRDTPNNENFFKYFTHFVEKDTVTILMCYFSKEKDTWNTRLELDRKRIAKQTTKNIVLSLAKDPEDLLKKLEMSDVLYVAGGDAKLIEPLVSQLKSLKEKIKGKVYIGCSMGAFIISDQYVLSFDEEEPNKVHRGLGLLPISTLCHWDKENNKEEKVNLLKRAAPESPILTLDECTFSIFIN
ncbi:MAG: Type 1 glutamine amidotransferase-like domain-containing protein [Patescibacteria group bacterium]